MLTLAHFDRTTTVVTDDADHTRFHAELDPSWASLRGIHGGYMTSLAVRAAELLTPERQVRTVSTSFLRPAEIGPVEIATDIIRNGRSLTTVNATIVQGERLIATVRITSTVPLTGHDWSTVVSDRPEGLARAVTFTPPPQIRHFEQAELLLDPNTVPVGDGSRARVAGHVRPIEARPIDAAWLTVIGD